MTTFNPGEPMAAAVSVTPDLAEIRGEAEQIVSDVIDHIVDNAIDGVVDATIDEFDRVDNPTPDAIKQALKRALRKGIKRPLKLSLYDAQWAIIQGVVNPDRLGAGITLIWRTARDLLSTPEGLREKAERAERQGNESRARELRQRADQLEEARRGNDR